MNDSTGEMTYNEGYDDPTKEHILMLDKNEKAMVAEAKANFDKVIVLINSSNIMQIDELQNDPDIDAILWIGGPGASGFKAVGSILTGDVNPSGRTVDLWWSDFTKDPTWYNVGNNAHLGDEDLDMSYYLADGTRTKHHTLEYREGIYMGYRYAETKRDDMNAADTTDGNDGDAWYDETVTYPFGYGLSYTDFRWELVQTPPKGQLTDPEQEITLRVKVTNVGERAGKDVVQIYSEPPYKKGGIEKASMNLETYAKTDLLQPGESQTLKLTIIARDLASFDADDINGNGFEGYELEQGEYKIYASRNSHDRSLTVTRTVGEDGVRCTTDPTTGAEVKPVFTGEFSTVNDSLEEHMISRADGLELPEPVSKADRTITGEYHDYLNGQISYDNYQDEESDPWYVESVPETWSQHDQYGPEGSEGVREVPVTNGENTMLKRYYYHMEEYEPQDIKLRDMAGIEYTEARIDENGVVTQPTDAGSKLWETFMNQLTWTELCNLVTKGANMFGSPEMPSIGKPRAVARDGSGQMRLGARGSGANQQPIWGTCWPTAVIVAATYNVDLAYEQGRAFGNQGIFASTPLFFGTSANIHRSPFSGRNFEYYSQDGVQGGLIAAAVVKGMASKGLVSHIKHMFLNDQEYYRDVEGGICTWVDEQTIREVYIPNFEMAVKAGSLGTMTSYNRIGDVVSGCNYALLTELYRHEWGFKGFTTTDNFIRSYMPITLMVRAGLDQILGDDDYTGYNPSDTTWRLKGIEYNGLNRGIWDPELQLPLVHADADDTAADLAQGTIPQAEFNTVASPTLYYAVRTAAQRVLYVHANSIANNNGWIDGDEVEAHFESGVSKTVEIDVPDAADYEISLVDLSGYDGDPLLVWAKPSVPKDYFTDSELPDGLTLEGNRLMLKNNAAVEKGTYTLLMRIRIKGYNLGGFGNRVRGQAIVLTKEENAEMLQGTADTGYYSDLSSIEGLTVHWKLKIVVE